MHAGTLLKTLFFAAAWTCCALPVRGAVIQSAAAGELGGRIVFVARGDIYTITPDGKDRTRLTTDGRCAYPAWSRNRSQIAFIMEDMADKETRGRGAVYVMKADGSDKRRLSDAPASHCTTPLWSPTEDRIAYLKRHYGPGGGWHLHIADMKKGGEVVQRLSAEGLDQPTYCLCSWTPDGEALVVRQSDPIQSILLVSLKGASSGQARVADLPASPATLESLFAARSPIDRDLWVFIGEAQNQNVEHEHKLALYTVSKTRRDVSVIDTFLYSFLRYHHLLPRASWGLGGKHLVFEDGKDIYVAQYLGSWKDVRKLAEGHSPQWSQ